jgi:hypothetical protein
MLPQLHQGQESKGKREVEGRSTADAIASALSGVTGIGTSTDGKLAEAQPMALDDDDRSTPEDRLDGRQAREDEGDLFGASALSPGRA